ncbi:hypothetical protein ACFX10_037187 [Malus domestica]
MLSHAPDKGKKGKGISIFYTCYPILLKKSIASPFFVTMFMYFQSHPDTWTGLVFSAPLFVKLENMKPSLVFSAPLGFLNQSHQSPSRHKVTDWFILINGGGALMPCRSAI